MFLKEIFVIFLIALCINQISPKSLIYNEKHQNFQTESKRFVRSAEENDESEESDENNQSENKSDENDENHEDDNNEENNDEDQDDAGGNSGDKLLPEQCLKKGESITSPNKCFKLIMQGDGNLVLYRESGGALFSSKTAKTCSNRACMQGDGNFVVYDCDNKATWSSKTDKKEGSSLRIQNDGNIVIYAWQSNRAIWSSKTRTYC
ncbi:hypothetical protein PVAND_014772 [Polypedilum vanderplanki]|uniref:Bulb-type lectin domain-containing protein n=1 Tax=Polypedilum vanderplanki TaxID=319348 RepID=A0A9J6BAP1_POLVA|nr:hypothetical protein PVAND_014772 [Polypedilum vanderplanki]